MLTRFNNNNNNNINNNNNNDNNNNNNDNNSNNDNDNNKIFFQDNRSFERIAINGVLQKRPRVVTCFSPLML